MPISFKQAGSLFVAGPNIDIYSSGNTYAISGSATGTIISGTNAGTGFPIFSAAVGTNLVFRRILSGTNINVYTVGNDIVISGTTGSTIGVTGVTNIGGGSQVLSSVTSGVLIARTISGSTGIDATESGSVILVKPTNTSANRLYIAGTGGLLTTDANFGADATTGSISIGSSVSTTSRLAIAFGTAAVSQLRLEKYAALYTGATDGDIWYNTAGNTLKFKKSGTTTDFIFKDNNQLLTSTTTSFRVIEVDTGGTIFANRNLITLGVFNMITSVTISNSNVETSILSTGTTALIGSNILNNSNNTTNPQLIAGKKYRFNAKGIISGISGTFYAKILIGTTLIASSATFNLSPTISGGTYFETDNTFTIRTQGTSGIIIGSGKMFIDKYYFENTVTPNQIKAINSLGSVTADTTSNQYFDFDIKFGTANATNSLIINEATLEYLN